MELYNTNEMPLSNDEEKRRIQEKIINGEIITTGEAVKLHTRDHVIKKIGNYECKPDYCYRAISPKELERYKEYGYVKHENKEEFIPYENNKGIDWYLGGACPGKRYGSIIIECPAYKEYFVPNIDNGSGLSDDPLVRHMKSSTNKNPIPFELITNIFDYKEILLKQKEELEELNNKMTR